jgi:AraC family transcriptional regulator of arabinose operon
MHEPLSLDRVAQACGLSVSRLAHLFREQIGLPPQQYLEELRLQRAAQLLRSTGLRIGEVAAETGYAGAFYFSSRFRKKFGQSPCQYRRDG